MRIAVVRSRLSTMSFNSSGTPTLATFAPISATTAAITRTLYAHKYGNSVRITRQSLVSRGLRCAGNAVEGERCSISSSVARVEVEPKPGSGLGPTTVPGFAYAQPGLRTHPGYLRPRNHSL